MVLYGDTRLCRMSKGIWESGIQNYTEVLRRSGNVFHEFPIVSITEEG